MRIIIDGDACPKGVKKACEELAIKYNYELILVIDCAHELSGEFTVIQVPRGADSVDFKIVAICKKGDIVITQDYGLASIIMPKVEAIINPSGFLYNKFNIDTLLFQRHSNAKNRQNGKRTKGPKKRETADDLKFKELLEKTILNLNNAI